MTARVSENAVTGLECAEPLRGWLEAAVDSEASDLHVVAGHPPVLRIHGLLEPISGDVVEADQAAGLLRSLCPESVHAQFLSKQNLDFSFELDVDGRSRRFRANLFFSRGAAGACFRLIPAEIPSLDWAGFPREIATRLSQVRNGLVLISGVAGSGKSTTLAMIIDLINREGGRRIITIEEPVEYVIPHCPGTVVTQREVGVDVGSFADGLKYGLRQDPDVILVGEIRDYETAEIAIQAALTGHIVFSTLHTNDAPSTITRLRDMGVPEFMICATVEGILAQRLVRRICAECKEEIDPSDEILAQLGYKSRDSLNGQKFYRGRGCDVCNNTGYKGRIGIFELMVMNDEMRQMVLNKCTADELRDAAKEQGMLALREGGEKMMHQGLTSADEVIRETIVEG